MKQRKSFSAPRVLGTVEVRLEENLLGASIMGSAQILGQEERDEYIIYNADVWLD